MSSLNEFFARLTDNYCDVINRSVFEVLVDKRYVCLVIITEAVYDNSFF